VTASEPIDQDVLPSTRASIAPRIDGARTLVERRCVNADEQHPGKLSWWVYEM